MIRYYLGLTLFVMGFLNPVLAEDTQICPDVPALISAVGTTDPAALEQEMREGSTAAALALARQAEGKGDYVEAERLYRFVLFNNDGRGALALYDLHQKGHIKVEEVEKVRDYGYTLIKNNAMNGDGSAAIGLAVMYLQGQGMEADHTKAKEWFELADDAGKPMAAYHLGVLYSNGLSLPILPRKSLRYFKKASAAGLGEATRQVAIAYNLGLGVDRDEDQAFVCFQRSAEQGDMLAMRDLGNIYRVRGQQANSQLWYKKAADLGDPDSAYRLAQMLKNTNPELSKKYMDMAVAQKHHMASKVAKPGYVPEPY